jgi:type II restriction enzyme
MTRSSCGGMILGMPQYVADGYKSPTQRARVISEAWGEENLYCPSCDSPSLERSKPNTPVVDFFCSRCASTFQLKCQSRPFSKRINDAGYEAMRRAIVEGRTPNLLALQYDPLLWTVRGIVLIPSFAFSLSCVEPRKPLGPGARRKGWVGCHIVLGNIPPDARIALIADGAPIAPAVVREQYGRLRPLEKLDQDARGWTLDVLNAIRLLEKKEFSLADIYAQSSDLQALHPKNSHIREKIRQQLQRLRDLGLVVFLGRGRYLLK